MALVGMASDLLVWIAGGTAVIDDLHAYAWWAGGVITFALLIVLIVAVVMGISNTAMGIDTMADDIITTVRGIKANTDPLYDLGTTQNHVGSILSTVEEIQADCVAIGSMAGRDRAAGER